MASLVHSRSKLSTVVLACVMISNRFGATVGVVSIGAGVTAMGVPVGAGSGAFTCRAAADKHKLLGVRADSYNIILQ